MYFLATIIEKDITYLLCTSFSIRILLLPNKSILWLSECIENFGNNSDVVRNYNVFFCRMLIERLEREKHNLENRIKTLKSSNVNSDGARELEILKIENMKLLEDLRNLNSKLEMHQHHSGALGATMLQEKLECQERKIAILELTAKVSSILLKSDEKKSGWTWKRYVFVQIKKTKNGLSKV